MGNSSMTGSMELQKTQGLISCRLFKLSLVWLICFGYSFSHRSEEKLNIVYSVECPTKCTFLWLKIYLKQGLSFEIIWEAFHHWTAIYRNSVFLESNLLCIKCILIYIYIYIYISHFKKYTLLTGTKKKFLPSKRRNQPCGEIAYITGKIFAWHLSNRGLISRIYKLLKKLNTRITDQWINVQMNWTDTFQTKKYKWPINTWRNVSHP
jgi:hypothetical protein